ncbi:hypothetical protein N665_0651s0004 [Sinapis alba]|nr:hypothetical protein N665_0651s0004 [Sinapis alba]
MFSSMPTPHSHSPFSGGGVNSSWTIVLKKEDEFVLPYSLLLPQASPFLHAKVNSCYLIERLPGNLGKLQSVKVLMLYGNRISCLPDECYKNSLYYK